MLQQLHVFLCGDMALARCSVGAPHDVWAVSGSSLERRCAR